MKAFIPILALATAAYAGLCAWLYVNQRNMLYFPRPEVYVESAEPIWLDTADARLKIWSVAGAGREAIVYFGGNAEPVHANIEAFRAWFPEHSVYLVNYRGYGGSSGTPNEVDLCADAAAVYDYLDVRHSRISAIGRSLGSGVAACLASQRELAKLALITPFDSVLAVASNLYPFLPVSILLQDTFDSAARAPAIDADVLIMLASEDEVIPMKHGYSLARAFAPDQVRVLEIRGADHIDISEFAEYGTGLREFL
jgi:pimeloyl-ACP methyl ester carboxylesterase